MTDARRTLLSAPKSKKNSRLNDKNVIKYIIMSQASWTFIYFNVCHLMLLQSHAFQVKPLFAFVAPDHLQVRVLR